MYEIRRYQDITKFVPFGTYPTKHAAMMRITRLLEISPGAKFTIHRLD